jgi:hypothetical protein
VGKQLNFIVGIFIKVGILQKLRLMEKILLPEADEKSPSNF